MRAKMNISISNIGRKFSFRRAYKWHRTHSIAWEPEKKRFFNKVERLSLKDGCKAALKNKGNIDLKTLLEISLVSKKLKLANQQKKSHIHH